MFEITECDRPPLHLYVYTSCERPSIYGQLKNTNNHPPRVKNLLLLSAEFCNAFVYTLVAFWLPVYYYWVSAEPMGIRPVPKRCQAFSSPFPARDIIVYSPNTHWCLSCLQPGWHTHMTRKPRLNTRCSPWVSVRGRPGLSPDVSSLPLAVMKRRPGSGFVLSNWNL